MRSWQACPCCGGVLIVWKEPYAPSPVAGDTITADPYEHRDGTPCVHGEEVYCHDCGISSSCGPVVLVGFELRFRRWGEELPPVPEDAKEKPAKFTRWLHVMCAGIGGAWPSTLGALIETWEGTMDE